MRQASEFHFPLPFSFPLFPPQGVMAPWGFSLGCGKPMTKSVRHGTIFLSPKGGDGLKRFLLLVLPFLLLFCTAKADTDNTLPADIQEFFSPQAYDGMNLLSAVDGTELGGTDASYFVLIRTAEDVNTLYVFSLEENTWGFSFSTCTAVPQTDHEVTLSLQSSGEEFPTFTPFSTPQLSILQSDAESEYTELCITFELSNGQWLLHRVWSYTDYDSMLIQDSTISYYEDLESTNVAGTISCTVSRDLKDFDLSLLPKTLQEAQNQSSSSSGVSLHAQNISFTANQKYAVYSAPSTASLRGANGKAAVSTNGQIQVFGQENGWLLVQYAIDTNHARIGYIDAKSLSDANTVSVLNFSNQPAYTQEDTVLTDDPLYSQEVLYTLPAEASVTWLASMDDWAYVQYGGSNGIPSMRGFVKATGLTLLTKAQASEIAESVFLNAQEGDVDTPLSEDQFSIEYDSSSAQWVAHIITDLASQNECTIIVDDRTGSSWVEEISHG